MPSFIVQMELMYEHFEFGIGIWEWTDRGGGGEGLVG